VPPCTQFLEQNPAPDLDTLHLSEEKEREKKMQISLVKKNNIHIIQYDKIILMGYKHLKNKD